MKKCLCFGVLAISSGLHSSQETVSIAVAVSKDATAQCLAIKSALELEVTDQRGKQKHVVGAPECFGISFSPKGEHLGVLTNRDDDSQVLHVHDRTEGTIIHQTLAPKGRALFEVVALYNGAQIMVGGMWNLPVSLYDLGQSKISQKLPKSGHTQSIAVSDDGNLVVQGRFKDLAPVVVWDAREASSCYQPKTGQCESAWSVALSPDGWFVGAIISNIVNVWDRRTDDTSLNSWEINTGKHAAIAFGADGSKIRYCSESGIEELSLTAE